MAKASPAIAVSASGASHAVAAASASAQAIEHGRRHGDAQARVVDILDVVHEVAQTVLAAELPAGRPHARSDGHCGEQAGAPRDLIDQSRAMSHQALAIFCERPAQRQQAHQGGRKVEVERQGRRGGAGQRHGAEEPRGHASEQDAGGPGDEGERDREPPWRLARRNSGGRFGIRNNCAPCHAAIAFARLARRSTTS